MKNKKKLFQGYNRKQLKKVATELQKEVTSITELLENERAMHKECEATRVRYINKNMDLIRAHNQDKTLWMQKLQDKEAELTEAKYRNEKLVEQIDHFTGEVKRLEVEIEEISSRSLLQKLFNMGGKHEKFKAR